MPFLWVMDLFLDWEVFLSQFNFEFSEMNRLSFTPVQVSFISKVMLDLNGQYFKKNKDCVKGIFIEHRKENSLEM